MQEQIMELVAELLRRSMYESPARSLDTIRAEITDRLVERGYLRSDIERVLSLLTYEEGPDSRPLAARGNAAQRVFSGYEVMRLSVEARGFIIGLERAGMLEPEQREELIERALLCPTPEVDLQEVQRIARTVLSDDEVGPDDGYPRYH